MLLRSPTLQFLISKEAPVSGSISYFARIRRRRLRKYLNKQISKSTTEMPRIKYYDSSRVFPNYLRYPVVFCKQNCSAILFVTLR